MAVRRPCRRGSVRGLRTAHPTVGIATELAAERVRHGGGRCEARQGPHDHLERDGDGDGRRSGCHGGAVGQRDGCPTGECRGGPSCKDVGAQLVRRAGITGGVRCCRGGVEGGVKGDSVRCAQEEGHPSHSVRRRAHPPDPPLACGHRGTIVRALGVELHQQAGDVPPQFRWSAVARPFQRLALHGYRHAEIHGGEAVHDHPGLVEGDRGLLERRSCGPERARDRPAHRDVPFGLPGADSQAQRDLLGSHVDDARVVRVLQPGAGCEPCGVPRLQPLRVGHRTCRCPDPGQERLLRSLPVGEALEEGDSLRSCPRTVQEGDLRADLECAPAVAPELVHHPCVHETHHPTGH